MSETINWSALRRAGVLLAAFAMILAGAFLIQDNRAYASTTPAGPSFTTCPNLADWFVNPDETERRPIATESGLEFDTTDLIHHNASLDLADLEPGTFHASSTPDQPSFFSVEVSGSDGKYGTLRWNSTEGYWEATAQSQQLHDADPVKLADAFPDHLSHHVVRFGVGYTEHPAGTVTTVVSSVTFQGKAYDLTCEPVTETTSPAPHESSSSPAPHVSTAKPHSSSSAPVGAVTGSGTTGGALPITGPGVRGYLFIAAGLCAFGALVLWLVARRRKVSFTA